MTESATRNPTLRRLEAVAVRSVPPVVRITAGLLWLTNLGWKIPPSFGEDGGGGLFGFTVLGIEHPILPPYTWVLENVILPNFVLFGWVVLIVETSLAAMLLSGTLTRFAALVGAAQGAVIGLTVGRAPDEWGWSYILMVAVHLAIFAMPSGRVWAVDGLRSQRESESFPGAVRAGRAAIVAATAGYGLLVVLLALDEPFVGSGATNTGVAGIQGSAALGILLVLLGVAVFVAGGRPARGAAVAFLALAVAAVGLYGSDANVLSAGPTTAAVLAVGTAFLLASAPRRT